MPEDEIESKFSDLVQRYENDLQNEIVHYELKSLKTVYATNFGDKTLQHLKCSIISIKSILLTLQFYLTIPATVASA